MVHLVKIKNANVFYSKLPEIRFLHQLHGIIHLEYPPHDKQLAHVSTIFTLPCKQDDADVDVYESSTDLARFSLDPREKKLFAFTPIHYVANGLMGDFIHSLSVVHQKFLSTGRKGVVYLSDRGSFRHGILQAFEDTRSLLLQQPYIQDYLLYKGQPYDIDLSQWIISERLFRCNWHELFKSCYNVDWGLSPWLHVEKDDYWSDKVLVHSSLQRPLPITGLLQSVDLKNVMFVSQSEKEWETFQKNNPTLEISYHKPNSFYDMVVAIASCKLFVGSLSAPLAIAHACFTASMTKDLKTIDSIHVRTLPLVWPHFRLVD